MKQFLKYSYFLFYILSLIVLEIFFDVNIMFNYAIFMGIVFFLEVISISVSYVVYKALHYYILQKDQLNINKTLFLILKNVSVVSMIGFFLVFFSSKILSNLVISNNQLVLIFKLSSIMFFILPFIGLFRGFLYILGYKKLVYISYTINSFLQFILIFFVTLTCYLGKFDSTYILILSSVISYSLIFLYLLFCSKKVFVVNKKKINFNLSKKDFDINKRIESYSFIFIFVLLFLVMLCDIFYGKFLLSMGVSVDDIKNFVIVTSFVGQILNTILIFGVILFYGKIKINKDNLLTTLIGLFKLSLPVVVFMSLVYNYYFIYRYFIYLVPLQLGCLIILIFLYNQNKRKIIFDTICLMFLVKQFLNVILLNSFKYTGILTYNALITSSILTYLLFFVILAIYIVRQFRLAGEIFVKSFFDLLINLVFTVSILLIMKTFFYQDNLFYAIFYVVSGMCLYVFIPKIIKYL